MSGDLLSPDDLSILDRSAFCFAFHEEMERADKREPAVDVMERAMVRVRAFIAARDAPRSPYVRPVPRSRVRRK